jgi:hypothetical protein
MKSVMRSLAVLAFVGACGTSEGTAVHTYNFGPFTVQPNQEVSDQCVQITLHNADYIYVNAVELTTGNGFHHSNWFFDPADNPQSGAIGAFSGPDGVFTCSDRGFDQGVAAMKGGVLFAQSTQSAHDIQQFPPGHALRIPPNSKLVTTIHLLNTSDQVEALAPKIALTEIPEKTVTTLMAGMSFEDAALGLPPMRQSQFSVDCDLAPEWNVLVSNGQETAPSPDFHLFYALAHYHALGTGMLIEAGTAAGHYDPIFQTSSMIGDSLGSPLDPVFDMTGYTHIRFTCDYYNDTASTVVWGIGNQEMCVFLGFSDSAFMWGGGAVNPDPPGDPTLVGNVMAYSHVCDIVTAIDASH